jgi:nucleotide-binding universal stress UspA family protein
MKTYKNIAVATDFSKQSINAYQYALHLAEQLGATLTVVHAFNMPLNPLTPEYTTSIDSIDELERVSAKRLRHFVNESMPHEGNTMVVNRTNVKAEAIIGLAADVLIEYSKKPSTDLLILGTAEGFDWVDKLMGSISINVMHGAHCPILLVPEASDFSGIEQILYTVAQDASSNEDVDSVISFADPFDAAIHYVHVKEVSETPETEQHLKQFLAEKLNHSPYVIESVTAPTVAEGINAYCLEHPIDLVVTVAKHRRFWDDLMHFSISKELGWQSHLPILCLHSDDKHKVY